jgi:hypothetical protein
MARYDLSSTAEYFSSSIGFGAWPLLRMQERAYEDVPLHK